MTRTRSVRPYHRRAKEAAWAREQIGLDVERDPCLGTRIEEQAHGYADLALSESQLRCIECWRRQMAEAEETGEAGELESVTMPVPGALLTLSFGRGSTAPLREVRLTSENGALNANALHFDASRCEVVARAVLAERRGDNDAAWRMLRSLNAPSRGLDAEFLGLVARAYKVLVSTGEHAVATALANAQGVDISTASRWITAARARGLLSSSDGD